MGTQYAELVLPSKRHVMNFFGKGVYLISTPPHTTLKHKHISLPLIAAIFCISVY